MTTSSFDDQLNSILLKPRFSFEHNESKEAVLKKFKEAFTTNKNELRGKVVGDHIVIDVAKAEEHFWSPQLQLEVEEAENGKTSTVKGLFGPKPTLWTLFMFIHFGVALAFAVFATMLYTDWSLKQDYTLSLILTILMPVLWVSFYLFGRWGKKKGHVQMVDLDGFMREVLDK